MVGPGRSSVTVTVGAGRGTVTVTVGCGCGTLTVTAGAGLPTRGGVTLRSACAQTATISASPMAALITSKALSCRRLGSFLRRLLPDRGSCWVITPLMVDPYRSPVPARSESMAIRSAGRELLDRPRVAAGGRAGRGQARLSMPGAAHRAHGGEPLPVS